MVATFGSRRRAQSRRLEPASTASGACGQWRRAPFASSHAAPWRLAESSIAPAAHLFIGSFALHVLEEAPGFTEWAGAHASERYSQRDFVRNNSLGLAITAAGTYALLRRPPGRASFFTYYSAILTQQALFNTVFHVATTAAWRTYSPGLVSSVTLFLPGWWLLTRRALDSDLISKRGVLAASAIGGAIHSAALARQVFFIGIRERSSPS